MPTMTWLWGKAYMAVSLIHPKGVLSSLDQDSGQSPFSTPASCTVMLEQKGVILKLLLS